METWNYIDDMAFKRERILVNGIMHKVPCSEGKTLATEGHGQ